MGRKRRCEEIIESEVGIYHITDRCVRRAFLLGTDNTIGKCFDYRRVWLKNQLEELARYFLIDIISFCVMANHLHLILRNRPDLVEKMSDEDVIRAWWEVSPGYRRHRQKGRLTPKRLARLLRNSDHIRKCRERLSSISWFMRYLKHPLAIRANVEDDRSGHFWEARFRVKPLDSMRKLTNAMIYVDLNPIRAGLATSVKDSQFTSAQERIRLVKRRRELRKKNTPHAKKELQKLSEKTAVLEQTDHWLSPIQIKDHDDVILRNTVADQTDGIGSDIGPDRQRASDRGVLPISTKQYLSLVDIMGRRQRSGKRGKIPPGVPPILSQLGFESPDDWLLAFDNYAERHEETYRRKVNSEFEAQQVELPLVNPDKTNQDALR